MSVSVHDVSDEEIAVTTLKFLATGEIVTVHLSSDEPVRVHRRALEVLRRLERLGLVQSDLIPLDGGRQQFSITPFGLETLTRLARDRRAGFDEGGHSA